MDTDTSSRRFGAPLAPIQRWIVAGWAGVAVGLAVWFIVSLGRDPTEWADLVAIVAVVFAVAALVALVLTYVLVRLLSAGRTLAAILGPPGFFVLGLLGLRLVL